MSIVRERSIAPTMNDILDAYREPANLTKEPNAFEGPNKVQPKSYFANERTFLRWMNLSIILGAVAIGLLNFGDSVSTVSALFLSIISVGIMLYGLYLFRWRAGKISRKEIGTYDDDNALRALTIIVFVAIGLTFAFRMIYGI
ncbi:GTPase regulator Nrf1 [Basidiobolus ranarum]|uniref:GTPase regulator Nrf1 n=1 Tax=Basidiobolus ranarum TaxID=34480 RepID=A0ABR2WB80_9FUNG